MIFPAEDLSRFERCQRLPQIRRSFEPPRWPVREATKMYFEKGIRGVMAGESPELTVNAFLDAAAKPGFVYPQGEPYALAQDHAAWLDGALRIIQEEHSGLQPLPVYQLEDHHVVVDGWTDGTRAHVFRASSNLGGRAVKWSELVLLAFFQGDIAVHVFRLPQVRDGRLVSPLVTAYQHPSFAHIQYRLSRLYDEPEFGKNWKKVSRWEIQPVPSWQEWKLGIDRDKCIDKIRESYTISPISDPTEKERIRFDAAHMAELMESPTLWARYREACQSCIFTKLCHGTQEDRETFTPYRDNFPLDK